jgi:hypothetical protein
VKAYTIIERRAHPVTGKACDYREEVTRDRDMVVYQTYLDGEPYAWPGNEDATGAPRKTWRESYGFVPFVWVNHIDTGVEYGLSELHLGPARLS